MRYLYMTGCYIPMFVAGRHEAAIAAIAPPDERFEWHSFYDKDDGLGWRLRRLSTGWRGYVIASWNLLAHSRHRQDREVLARLDNLLRALLANGR